MTGNFVDSPDPETIDGPTFDHLAIGTDRFDDVLELLVGGCGMEVARVGTHFSTGCRLVMLRGPRGGMIELVESSNAGAELMHIAYRVDDVPLAVESLIDSGLTAIRPPHQLEAARAETALLSHSSGLQVQVIKYAADSPDLR